MNEDFIFRLGADVSGFTKSISQVDAELKKVQTELKTKTGAAIIEANKYIVELQGSLKNLREVGLDKLPKAATAGASSLNALGQVARDAPFGFIAIQNNLPILFDQLGTLSSKSGGAIGALKSLGASLIGPAGVTFAIGGAISAITVLVQKYGSFGAALEAIFTKQSRLSDEILDFNKELTKYNEEKRTSNEITKQEIATTEGQISKIRSLSSIVLDQTRSYNERNSALNALKEINKEHFGNLDLEKTKFEDLDIAIKTYISSVRQAAVSKGFESAISDASVELAKAIELESKLKKELALTKRTIKTKNRGQDIDTSDIDVAKKALDEQSKVVKSLRDEIALYNRELDKSITLQNKIQAPIDAANKALEDKKKKEAEDAKRETERKRRLQERVRAEEKARNDALRIVEERIKRQDFLNKEDNKNLEATIKERRKLEREAGIIIPKLLPTTTTIPVNTNKLKENAEIASNALKSIKQEANLDAAFNLAQDTFFNPISDVFENFLNTGKFAFKEFGKAVLQAINQIVAKIIATGIISLLFTIFSGGFGAAAGGAKGGFKTVLSAITSSLGFNIGKSGGGGQPNLANITGGGMQLAGEVVFMQRGSDLVGVLNRTNGTINRVG
jgi:phage-related minor tail protein